MNNTVSRSIGTTPFLNGIWVGTPENLPVARENSKACKCVANWESREKERLSIVKEANDATSVANWESREKERLSKVKEANDATSTAQAQEFRHCTS